MGNVLTITNISKKYDKKLVLDKVNMSIDRGDIYGFVGENGSGKTTIIRLITGLIFPNEGDIELFGINSKSSEVLNVRKKVGAIVETPSIYKNMSAKDNLLTQASLLNITDLSKVDKILDIVGLGYLINDKKQAGNFSLGMRQRLGIAMALISDPEFIILDEPMNGLDPTGIVEIRELILKLNKENGITFLISSHILNELALVANRYGIISKGKMVKEISLEDLKKECRKSVVIEVNDPSKLVSTFIEYGENVEFIEKGIKITDLQTLNEIIEKVLKCGVEINSINTHETNIEEYYLSLVGGNNNA